MACKIMEKGQLKGSTNKMKCFEVYERINQYQLAGNPSAIQHFSACGISITN